MTYEIKDDFYIGAQVQFIARGMRTKRYHTEEVIAPQSVGEHSCGVALLVSLLSPTASKELILAALTHDLAEHVVGDVPAPSKRSNPALKTELDALESSLLGNVGLGYGEGLTKDELNVLKVADIMDGMLYCINERLKGNRYMGRVYQNFESYLVKLELTEEGEQIYKHIRFSWSSANER